MEYKNETVTLDALFKRISKGKYNFQHPLQRKPGQWSKEDRDKLIDSAIRQYLIDRPLVAVENDKIAVIDGIQRITYFHSYFKDEFALGELKPVIVDGVEYDISTKKFSEQDDVIKDLYLSFEFSMDKLLKWTYEELVDMFDRRNSGKRLSKAQKMTVYIGPDFGEKLIHLMNHEFFSKTLTPAQIRASEDRQIILQVLMVLSGYDYQGFDNEKDIPKFIGWFQDNMDDELLQRLEGMMTKLVEILPEKMPKKKLVVPLILIAFDKVYGKARLELEFVDWLKDFYNNYSNQTEFLGYCNGGTTKPENVKGRINFFLNEANKLLPIELLDESDDSSDDDAEEKDPINESVEHNVESEINSEPETNTDEVAAATEE